MSGRGGDRPGRSQETPVEHVASAHDKAEERRCPERGATNRQSVFPRQSAINAGEPCAHPCLIYFKRPKQAAFRSHSFVSRLDYDCLRDDVTEVLNTLEPLERRVTLRDGSAHDLLRILPYSTPDSAVDGSVVTFVDVTRIVQAEEHQRLLVDELNHRVKNMLSVVISLATQTLRRSGTLEEFEGVFLGRVHALTAA